MEIYTIGFTKKSASEFFGILRRNGIRRLIDIRLNNNSQLSGFTKSEDLKFFLKELCEIEYVYEPLLTPTDEILDSYKKKQMSWADYEKSYLDLVKNRKIEEKVKKSLFDVPSVLLCSEAVAAQCHRRLAAEYLSEKWGNITIKHI